VGLPEKTARIAKPLLASQKLPKDERPGWFFPSFTVEIREGEEKSTFAPKDPQQQDMDSWNPPIRTSALRAEGKLSIQARKAP